MREFNLRIKEAADTLSFTDFPEQVIIETIANCNLKCPSCPSRLLNRQRGVMDDSLFKKIIDEVAHHNFNTEIYPAYMGEPLLDNKIFDHISYAKRKGIKKVYLNTNGMLMTKNTGRRLMESGVDRIILSIDGFSPETYERCRAGAIYEEVKKNTLNLLSIKKAHRYQTEIWVQMIIDKNNAHEEDFFISYWLSKGAVVKIRPQLTWGGVVGENYLSDIELERIPCPWLLRQIVVTWNGEISMCDADYEATSNLGNVTHQSIQSIWNNAFKKLRIAHMNMDFTHAHCRNCHDWKVGKSEIHYPSLSK